MTDATLIWKEGLPGWQPLAEVPEIKAAVSALPSAAASAGGAALQPATGTSAAQPVVQRRGATVVKAAKAERIAPVDRELAAFQAEMSALGATAAPGAEGGDVAVEPERAETPPPEDRRFQDDDGTWFVWDSTLRRFVEDVSFLTPVSHHSSTGRPLGCLEIVSSCIHLTEQEVHRTIAG